MELEPLAPTGFAIKCERERVQMRGCGKRLGPLALASLLIVVASCGELNVLRDRLLQSLTLSPTERKLLASNASSWVAKLRPNGTWADIDLHPPASMDTRSHWPPSEHIARVQTLAQLGLNLGNASLPPPAPSAEALIAAAKSALRFWLTANLTNPDNWYPQRISTPRAIGIACLALQGQGALDTALGAACHMGMRGAQWDTLPPGMTNISGANLLWIATCRTYDGVLLGNTSHVAEATSRMWAELAITGGGAAGLKEDWSFAQHCHGQTRGGILVGPIVQLYTGGYGQGFFGYLLRWLGLCAGTAFAMPAWAMRLLASALLDGAAPMILGGVADASTSTDTNTSAAAHWDASVIGREISRPNHRVEWTRDLFDGLPASMPRRNELVRLGARVAMSVPPPDENMNQGTRENVSVSGLEARAQAEGRARYFWKSDYFVHTVAARAAGAAHVSNTSIASFASRTFTLRMASVRTLNTECIAHENRQGKHLGLGALFHYRDGQELTGTYPVWDWQRVPGTTVELDNNTACAEISSYPPTNASCWVNCRDTQTQGKTKFVGAALSIAPPPPSAALGAGAEGVVATRGVAALDFRSPFGYSSLRYRSSWHFVDGCVVMLVAGLRSGGRNGQYLPLQTTLAQQRRRGPVYASPATWPSVRGSGSGSGWVPELGPGRHRAAVRAGGAAWWWHDGVGYVVQMSQSDHANKRGADCASELAVVELVDEWRDGDWATIGAESGAVRERMFDAAVIQPNATATAGAALGVAAVFAPVAEYGAFDSAAWTPRRGGALEVLSNAEAMQAVLARGLATNGQVKSSGGGDGDQVLSVSFFAANTVLSTPNASAFGGARLAASHPCVVVLTAAAAGGSSDSAPASSAVRVSVAEPTQNLEELELYLSGLNARPRAGREACCARHEGRFGDSGGVHIRVALPRGERAGSTVTCELCA